MSNNSAGYPWLKFYTAWLDDPKFFKLSDTAKAIYFEIYLLAGRSDAGGIVLAGDDLATISDIAFILRRDEVDLRAGLDELQKVNLIKSVNDEVMVTKFETYQGPTMLEKREAWRKRQQKKRSIARGEDPEEDPEEDQEEDPEQEENSEKNLKKEKELKDLKDLKIKDTDKESHAGHTRESRVTKNADEGGGVLSKIEKFESEILDIWNGFTGQSYKTNTAFRAMMQTFMDEGVTANHFRSACEVQSEKGKMPVTSPLGLQSWAINIKNKSATGSARSTNKTPEDYKNGWTTITDPGEGD